MKRLLITCSVALALTVAVSAQDEMNSAGGSLTSNGTDPFGTTFMLGGNDSIDMEVGGNAGAGFLLLGGTRVSGGPGSGTMIPDGQYLDLINDGSIFVLGNGLGGGGGAIPAALMVLNSNGAAAFSFPVNPGVIGLCFGFQAVVFDPAALFQVNFTAAAEYCVSAAVCLQADDSSATFPVPSGSCNMYGQSFASCVFSTNGFISFGTTTGSDLSESATDFETGSVGSASNAGSPAIAIVWEDLDFGNRATQSICMDEPAPGLVTNTMIDADYFSATAFGNVTTMIDSTGASTVVTMDFTGYTNVTPPSEGLIGISDGGSAGATITTHDLVVGGVINPFISGTGTDTIYQNHDGVAGTPPAIAAEPFSMGGLIVTFVDMAGAGFPAYQ